LLSFLKRRVSRKRVVVIGLDGVPYSLLIDYMDTGIMPEFSELCRKGKFLKINSSLPEVSSVAWSSFITGSNPGQHGVFGFMELDPQTYEYTFPNFYSLKERPIWERLGVKTVVFNIPQTYPARQINGVMVSGFVALDLKKATYPNRIFDFLKGIDYRIDVNTKIASKDPDAFFKDLFETFERRKKAIEYLYDNEEWQLFICAITETDRLHHFFFDSARGGQYFEVFERFYRELDQFLGHIAKKAFKDGAVFMTCSDHGFTHIKTEVYLNRWLVENGYLKLNDSDGLKGMTSDTSVFSLDPSRIYIHYQDRYKKGTVKTSNSVSLLEELSSEFNELNYEGEKVIKRIFLRDDIFSGPYVHNGPDMYLLPNPGFDLKSGVNRESIFGTTHFKGAHTYDDAHLFISDKNADKVPMRIEDIAGLIENHFS
jgi:predicted AlkP superfamily phosphohydrolase/phosphomutase